MKRGVEFGIFGDDVDAPKLLVCSKAFVFESSGVVWLTARLLPNMLPEGPACTGLKALSVFPWLKMLVFGAAVLPVVGGADALTPKRAVFVSAP